MSELDKEIHMLTRMLAVDLDDGWRYEPSDHDNGDMAYLVRGQQKIGIHRDRQKPTHIIINTWAWPKSTSRYRGRDESYTHTPMAVSEVDPRISVALSRGHIAIAKDIKARLLAEYMRLWAICEARAKDAQLYADECLANWKAICSVLHVTPDHDMHYIKNYENDRESLTIERHGTQCRITYDANPEEALRIIKLIKPNAL